MKQPQNLEEFYIEELRDLYDAEKQLLKALPRMAKAASHQELKDALQEHAEQTGEQANRLEQILKNHGSNARGRKCRAMMGLIEEGQELMGGKPLPDIMDVGLITTAQKVEHYEMAGYGCTTTYAKLLGLKEDAQLLHQTLSEEKETDTRLTRLAKSIVNPEARDTSEEDGEVEPARGSRHRVGVQARTATRSTARKNTSGRAGNRASASGDGSRGRTNASRSSKSKRGGSRKQSAEQGQARGEARSTKDLEEIRAWAEARGGKPAKVCGTGSGKDPGLLRLDFPGYSGADSLQEISWEEWYDKFKENNLTFLYQDTKKSGEESRFFKLVCMEGQKK